MPSTVPAAERGFVPRPLRVLVADDERDTVPTLMTILEEEGCQVRAWTAAPPSTFSPFSG